MFRTLNIIPLLSALLCLMSRTLLNTPAVKSAKLHKVQRDFVFPGGQRHGGTWADHFLLSNTLFPFNTLPTKTRTARKDQELNN